uniref:Homeobox domain-containing protein n=1 Tax=Cannabis sativa TaxID=3483 RepID=A0A803NN69_CANSA
MATYVPNQSLNKKCDLASSTTTAAYHENDHEAFVTSLNQSTSPTEPFSMSFHGSSNYCVDSSQGRNEMMFIPTIATDSVLNGDSLADHQNNNLHYQGQGLSLSLGKQIHESPVSLTSFLHDNQYHYSSNPSLSSDHMGTCLTSNNMGMGLGTNQQNVESFNIMASGFLGINNNNSIKTECFGNQIMHQSERYHDQYDQPSYGFNNNNNNNGLNFKYLKAVQELLDEVVNVRKALNKNQNNHKFQGIGSDHGLKESDLKSNSQSADPSESTANSSCELSQTEQQDLQSKKSKLMSMLDDIDRKYKQYYNQMQTVVSFLDNVAGRGAAEPYTSLAQKTISRHFRCLRDGISGQIQAIQRRLGEQDNGQNTAIPRLRYVDLKLRQQRGFNQLAAMRHAWRPQRGLPETSVSILRAWLFEHFLHPYPKESEKVVLAKQTGLTTKQEDKIRGEYLNPLETHQNRRLRHETNVTDSETTKSPVDNNAGFYLEEDEAVRTSTTANTTTNQNHQNQASYDDISELSSIVVRNDRHVSLALELRHCESEGFSTLGGSHNMRGDDESASQASLDYHCLETEQQERRRQRSFNSDLLTPAYMVSGEEQVREACNPPGLEHVNDNYPFSGSSIASSSASLNRSYSTLYGADTLSTVISHSRYLKPTQSLLDEIVNVGGKAVEMSNEKYVDKLLRGNRRGGGRGLSLSSELRAEFCNSGVVSPEKQESQLKMTKLISLLEDVEGRYEKYYHQMEEIMGAFEMIAGSEAAKSYTALALQAMSRHFCSLRDAVVSRINVEKRKLSHDLPKISTGLSQLSLFDRETRNNRIPLQHLGMIQNQRQAWRPIRGLPETSVAILRAWLFEHFLHPYPNDSEKLMLASQTGLSKNQVSNWFINARVRLWKPMIEEMYKEEFGDSSEDSNPFAGGSMAGEGVTDHEED